MHSTFPTDPPDRRPACRAADSGACAATRRALWRLAAGALSLALVVACAQPHGAPVRVVIPTGSSFRAATESLAHAGIIGSPRLFRLYAYADGHDRDIQAGTYLLQRGTGWSEVLDALTEGKGLVHTITIPEGYALRQIVPLLARTLKVPEDSVDAAVRDTALLRELDVPTPTLEGYLFPDTYTFPDGTTARAAVERMVRQFEQEWEPQWDQQLQQLKMNRNDVVTLASIIEREAKRAEERPVISAVYHNRLRLGMPLQADPTVQYALGHHTERVLYKDLDVDSPYNTYRHPGLPPGPIASPGRASIVAALYPANVPYLYFVAFPDGHHEFHVSYAEHTQTVREARRARAESASHHGR